MTSGAYEASLLSRGFRSYLKRMQQSYTRPTLIFDLSVINRRIMFFRSLQREYNCRFLFAMKSFNRPEILRLFATSGIGFDVSNIGEFDSLCEAYSDAREESRPLTLSFTGPSLKSIIDMLDGSKGRLRGHSAIRELTHPHPIMINVDSIGQFRQLSERYDSSIFVGVRINNNATVSQSISPRTSRFGFARSDWQHVRNVTLHPNFRGLHCHIPESHRTATTSIDTASSIMNFVTSHNLTIQYLNLGGGMRGMTDDRVQDLLSELRRIVPNTIRLYFEPGELWSADCGFALCRVLDVMSIGSQDSLRVVVDISRDCHLRWCDPTLVVRMESVTRSQDVLIVGPTCHEDDIIGLFNVPYPTDHSADIRRGDILLLSDINGYAVAWNKSFNGIGKAHVQFYG